MDRIASFTINHLDLMPGLYVSRRDAKGDCVTTTFDLRITAPNREPVVDTPALHTIEHLAATFLRNHNMRRHTGTTKCPKPGRQLKPRRPPQPRQPPQPPQARGRCIR